MIKIGCVENCICLFNMNKFYISSFQAFFIIKCDMLDGTKILNMHIHI